MDGQAADAPRRVTTGSPSTWATLVQRKTGDNPHIWYDTAVMLRFAAALTDELAGIDPAHAAEYRQRLAAFQQSMQPVQAKIAALQPGWPGCR